MTTFKLGYVLERETIGDKNWKRRMTQKQKPVPCCICGKSHMKSIVWETTSIKRDFTCLDCFIKEVGANEVHTPAL